MSKCISFIKRYYSCRWRLCYSCTVAFLLMQTLRVDLSMAFVCMLKSPNRTTEEVNFTADYKPCSDSGGHSIERSYEGEFEWSDSLQANMLAGYFYGYMSTNLLGGVLADKYGGKRILGISLLSASILTILHPSLSRVSSYFTLALRILTGMLSGPVAPAIHSLLGCWGPPQEISLLVGFVFSGQILGSVVGHSVSGYLCVYGFDNGWGSIFYVFGGISLVFCCVWFYVVYDNPGVHPTISEEERSYIERTIPSEKVVKRIPWRQILSSPAVWAIVIGWFAYSWTDLSFQVLLPLYTKEALNIKTTSNGLMSSAPSIGQFIALPLCGRFADFILSKKYLSARCVRVLFQSVSLIVSASLLIVIGFLRCDQAILITVLLFLSGITISFTSGGALVNNRDIAPNYAGVVFGMANAIAIMSGSFSSLSTKALTPNGTQQEWQIVFALCAAVSVVGAILYVILARGEIQDWAVTEEAGSSVKPKDTKMNENI